MSLVGSLEDLGLADILQIVSLSRKSGMLVLRSEGGDGRIVLRDGLVQGACIKGEAESLRDLLVGGGFVESDAFERAREAAEGDLRIEEAFERECGLPAGQFESLRREHVERAVMRMFSWRSGEFSFEIGEDLESQDPHLILPSGLNTQYLAMEATRQRDENTRAPEAGADMDEPVFSGEEPTFSGEDAAEEPAPEPPEPPEDAEVLPAEAVEVVELAEVEATAVVEESTAVDALVFATAQRSDDEMDDDAPLEAEHLPLDESEDAASEVVVAAAEPAPDSRVPVGLVETSPASQEEPLAAAAPSPRRGASARQSATLVALDTDLSTLEWLKASVGDLFRRVHIFQRSEIAIDRIRQYLMRGTVPLVVVSDRAVADPASRGFVSRLRSLAPTMLVLGLRAEGAKGELGAGLDGSLTRPRSTSADPEQWHVHADQAASLCAELESWLSGARSQDGRRRARNALGRLKHVSDRLRDPSTQGEVLTLVLEFAAETFNRVAMFMVRDDAAAGIAQLGLPPTGGPDDEGMRSIEFAGEQLPEIFQTVLQKRTAVRSALGGAQDRELAMRLGAAAPAEAYAAPIESGGCVVALVYADNLPEEQPIRDSTALEIVLHEAGLALDRAHLERALAERT